MIASTRCGGSSPQRKINLGDLHLPLSPSKTNDTKAKGEGRRAKGEGRRAKGEGGCAIPRVKGKKWGDNCQRTLGKLLLFFTLLLITLHQALHAQFSDDDSV